VIGMPQDRETWSEDEALDYDVVMKGQVQEHPTSRIQSGDQHGTSYLY
jgi:hypothetical protein